MRHDASEPDAVTEPRPTASDAYRLDGEPVAASVFYATACDPQRSVVVEACAGSGKTWMLVSRMLRALLDGDAPQDILAITFTRKAAGEMRQRLDDWLAHHAAPTTTDAERSAALRERGVPPARADLLAPQLATLQERLLDSGRPVQILTLHAWFWQLVGSAPLELRVQLGLPARMALVEDVSEYEAELLRRFHAAVLRDDSLQADYRALLVRRGAHQTRQWLRAAWDQRLEFSLADAAGVVDTSVPPAGRAGGAHPVDLLVSAPWRQRLAMLVERLLEAGKLARRAAEKLEAALAQPQPRVAFDLAWAALFTDAGTRRKLGASVEQRVADAQGALEELAAHVAQQDAHLEQGRMARLTRLLLDQYADLKRQRGLVDMQDLERSALVLLRDSQLAAWVQERLDSRYRHVLVDEFQDTSPLQWLTLREWLAGYAGAGGGASGRRSMSLFIVGDPKQSIYRFRRAEPRVFEAAQAFVTQGLGGVLLSCDHTRRNAPAVLRAVDAVFAPAAAAGGFPGYRRHTTQREASPGEGVWLLPSVPRPAAASASLDAAAGAAPGALVEAPRWRDSLTVPREAAETACRDHESRAVADAIAACLRQPGWRPADVMVLARRRAPLRGVAAALQSLDIACAEVEAVPLLDSPEVRDLVALLDVLASPEHSLSLAHALRSPLFGVSDEDLALVATRAKATKATWWPCLLTLPPAALSPALHRARRLLIGWSEAARHLPPHDLLDRIVAEGALHERVARAVPATRQLAALASIDAVLGLSLELDGGRHATPYNFVRSLRRRVLRQVAPLDGDAVQLLTIHGAKGLEARAVFVLDADPQAPQTDTMTTLVAWPPTSAAPTAFAFVASEASPPPSLRALIDAERVEADREELNALYVAMTRARERLVFSRTPPLRAASPSWWERLAATTPPGSAAPWPPPGAAAGTTGDLRGAERTAEASPDLPAVAPASAGRRLYRLPMPRPSPASEGASADDADVGDDAQVDSRRDARSLGASPDTDATRLGQAVHRVLEWCTGAWRAEARDLAALSWAAAREQALPHPLVADVARLAAAVLHSPACAPYFRPVGEGGPAWAGNEVDVTVDARVRRIDRLVAFDSPGGRTWWVLDYKISRAPLDDPRNLAQLQAYRAAVAALQPNDTVRAAFISGAGEVLPLD